MSRVGQRRNGCAPATPVPESSLRPRPDLRRGPAARESRLGTRLLNRTTRRLSLTHEGEVFYARAKELLGSLDEMETEAAARTGQAVGTLKLTAPVSFGLQHLAPLWPAFMARHPQVRLEITLADHFVDLMEEGIDLAVRLESSSLVSRKLASTRLNGNPLTHARGRERRPVVSASCIVDGLLARSAQ